MMPARFVRLVQGDVDEAAARDLLNDKLLLQVGCVRARMRVQ
jgi:hypothetical protein